MTPLQQDHPASKESFMNTETNAGNARIKVSRGLIAVLMIAGFGGCATVSTDLPTALSESGPPRVARLMPGDEIEVKFYHNPELNDGAVVRPDGKISLQLVHDVAAEGLTPEELRASLARAYTGILEKPEVCVLVRELKSRAVYVGGEVRSPGRITIVSDLTLLEAVTEAGGVNRETAQRSNVVLLRRSEGATHAHTVNLAAIQDGRTQGEIYLRPGDVVYVPSTRIANVNLWIAQHINQLVPQFGFTISHDVSAKTRVGLDTSR